MKVSIIDILKRKIRESTFVSIDDMESAQWNTAADGQQITKENIKRKYILKSRLLGLLKTTFTQKLSKTIYTCYNMNAIFTDASFQNIMQVVNRYGISVNEVTDLTHALMMSNGTMAQFNIPELGGGGQWMQGGMTMVGDMFNNQLKDTVDGLCVALSNLIHQGAIQYKPLPAVENQDGFNSNFAGNWWGDLGQPNSTGSQNNTSYAIFSNISRLAIQEFGKVTVFNKLDHQIGGVGQQQGGNYSVSFTSQYGNVDLGLLPIISGGDQHQAAPMQETNTFVENQPEQIIQEPIQQFINNTSDLEGDIFSKIEKLAVLKDKNIISLEEFENKKQDLLSKL